MPTTANAWSWTEQPNIGLHQPVDMDYLQSGGMMDVRAAITVLTRSITPLTRDIFICRRPHRTPHFILPAPCSLSISPGKGKEVSYSSGAYRRGARLPFPGHCARTVASWVQAYSWVCDCDAWPVRRARPTVTFPATEHHRPLAVPNYTAWWQSVPGLPLTQG